MLEVRFSRPVTNFLKKLRDKKLKSLFHDAVDVLSENPSAGQPKKGDLAGLYGYDFYYNGTNYEVAYTVENNGTENILVIVLIGTRENFYEQLKHYWL